MALVVSMAEENFSSSSFCCIWQMVEDPIPSLSSTYGFRHIPSLLHMSIFAFIVNTTTSAFYQPLP
jgi:hypothetical protein